MIAQVRNIFALLLILACFASSVSARDAMIRGVVTDQAGKPIRGASITAATGNESTTVFSQGDGRYRMAVKPGTYELSAEAFGFLPETMKKDTAQAATANFKLSAGIDVTRLTGAELDSLLPDTPEANLLRSSCILCHDLDTVLKKRGSNSAEWQQYLPTMSDGGKMRPLKYSSEELVALGSALEKYFGPDSPYWGPHAKPPDLSQIKHLKSSDDVLKAIFYEYKAPTSAWIPSVAVDASRGTVWFSEYDFQSNKVGRFDIATEIFSEYPIPVPKSSPHTPNVGLDGRAWMPLDGSLNIPTKLVSVDPATGKLKQYFWPGKQVNLHTVVAARDGILWFSSIASSDEFLSFNTKTEQFKGYKHALPATGSEGPSGEPSGSTYDVGLDSKGMIWFAEVNLGKIAVLNPASGETMEYQAPEKTIMRGLTVDANDNVWFSDALGNKIWKLDSRTKTFRMYPTPTPGSRPYGLHADLNTGAIWFYEFSGNSIARFDPKTSKFVEYPIPTLGANGRFVGIDAKGRIWFPEWWSGKIGVLDPGEPAPSASRARN